MSEDWRFDYRQRENAKWFSNPRADMAPSDYADDWGPDVDLDDEPADDDDE